MVRAMFSLENYSFSKVIIDLSKKTSTELIISFDPSGEFNPKNSVYTLLFKFYASTEHNRTPFVSIDCQATFSFDPQITFNDIPSYFYRNAIALLFPYLRAFVSTVTLQANMPPIILPTMNLSGLENQLKESTTQL